MAAAIIELVCDGLLSTDVAALRLRHLHEQGVIDAELLGQSLRRLAVASVY